MNVLIVCVLSVLLLSTTIRLYLIVPVRIPFKATKKIVGLPRDLLSSFLLENGASWSSGTEGFGPLSAKKSEEYRFTVVHPSSDWRQCGQSVIGSPRRTRIKRALRTHYAAGYRLLSFASLLHRGSGRGSRSGIMRTAKAACHPSSVRITCLAGARFVIKHYRYRA